jgi:hypothetical protein
MWAGSCANVPTCRLSVNFLFSSQATFGAATLQTESLLPWVGWGTIAWNLAWFGLLLRAKDPYYLALTYIMPLVIAVSLLSSETVCRIRVAFIEHRPQVAVDYSGDEFESSCLFRQETEHLAGRARYRSVPLSEPSSVI